MRLLSRSMLAAASTLLSGVLFANDGDDYADWAKRMASIVPKQYFCPLAEEGVVVDGILVDAIWQKAPWTDAFIDIQGDALPRPRFNTKTKIAWDESYLYVAAQMEEPHVWGTLTEHDSVIFRDNDFEVFIDPDGDTHEYYEFEINALNTGWDLHLPKPYMDKGSAVNEWSIPGLKTAVAIQGTLNDPSDTDQGWSVELAFPWSAFAPDSESGLSPKVGDVWRINFSRVQWQTDTSTGEYVKVPDTHEDNWVWSPQGVIDMHRPEMWGRLLFVGNEPEGSELSIDVLDKEIRDTLFSIYYAQRDYKFKRGRWAWSLNELALPDLLPEARLYNADYGYLARVPGEYRGSQGYWTIREDRKIEFLETDKE